MKRFHSSYAICSRFYLKLTRVNLNKNRKDREVEGLNQHHAKALGERPTSGAGRPAPVANLRGPFADVQARCSLFLVSCSGDFDENIGWPAWFRPPGLTFCRILFEFLWNIVSVILI